MHRLLALLLIAAAAGKEVCAPDIEPLDASPFRLEKSREHVRGGEPDDPRADARAISLATDADAFARACEAVLLRRYSARAACADDAACGGGAAGACADGRCNCTAGRAGGSCEVDVAGLCRVENFWTAAGGEGLSCAGSATRTACSAEAPCLRTQTCAITDRTCVCAPAECWDPATRSCQPNALEVSAKTWAANPSGEREDGELMRRTANFGIAFSGGGTRAMVSTLGVLRGLRGTGLLERALYLACNSGSCWAAAIYGYAAPESAMTICSARTCRPRR